MVQLQITHGCGARHLEAGADDRGGTEDPHANAHVGPGRGDGLSRQLHREDGREDLLLRPTLPLATRDQREHQRAHPRLLPEGHRLHEGDRRRGAQDTGPAERQATRDAGIAKSRRCLLRASGKSCMRCNHRLKPPGPDVSIISGAQDSSFLCRVDERNWKVMVNNVNS